MARLPEPASAVRTYGGGVVAVTVVRPGQEPTLPGLRAALVAAADGRAPVRLVVGDSGAGLDPPPADGGADRGHRHNGDPGGNGGAGVEVVALGEDAGHAAGANRVIAGLDPAIGLVALIRPGALPGPGALAVLVTAAARWPRAGVLGSCPDAVPRRGVRALRRAEGRPAPDREGPAERLGADLLLARRAALDSVDGFDARYPALAEADLVERMVRAGWLAIAVPGVEVRCGPPPDPAARRRNARRRLVDRLRGRIRARPGS
ncbi:MAG TPA: hypothetical protein VM367_15795 [Pseudonocardia sp.]|nr:hypothetical protein [Pseudonocardia sp.]